MQWLVHSLQLWLLQGPVQPKSPNYKMWTCPVTDVLHVPFAKAVISHFHVQSLYSICWHGGTCALLPHNALQKY